MLIWNARGVGNPPTQRHLHHICRQHKIQVLVIIEPMVPLDHGFFCRRLGFSNVVNNTNNKIWCFTSYSMSLVVLKDHEQFLHVQIQSPLLPYPVFLTCVYAGHTRQARRVLWLEFQDLAARCVDKPWISGGDFNTIISESERAGATSNRRLDMLEFADMILNCGLIDAGFTGDIFTWARQSLRERLDRVLYSSDWSSNIPYTEVTHLPRVWSDHAPLLVHIKLSSSPHCSTFRFFNMWFHHHSFMEVAQNCWSEPTGALGMLNLEFKLQRLKNTLSKWNRDVFGNVFLIMKLAEDALVNAEKRWNRDPSIESTENLNRCKDYLNYAETIEEAYWKQKACVKWLAEGERNTKYFHSIVKKKRSKSMIHSIEEDGVTLTDPLDIQESGIMFFQDLYTNNLELGDFSQIKGLVKIPETVNLEALCDYPTPDEIKQTVFSMCGDSVSGADGFPASFYQKCWDFVSEDVIEAVLDFFDGNPMPQSFLITTIILIPKVDNPKSWTEFRPISLCNVTNKIISKILNARLASILPDILAPNQSGFVKGRFISENILIAQEMFHSLGRKASSVNVALKLDMAKAYDRVQWSYLLHVLHIMGFPERWLDFIRNCIEQCWFTLLINGEQSKMFKSTRGLRQGDPLSPTLFVLAADFLSRGLNTLFFQNPSMYYRCLRGESVTHLSYADDILIFTTSRAAGLTRLLNFLNIYMHVSGQALNPHKSTFVISAKWRSRVGQQIQNLTGFQQVNLPITYLGAPLYTGYLKVSLFDNLIQKFKVNINAWENRHLSFGGRLLLIKSVLNSLTCHLFHVIPPPKSVIHTLTQLMSKFFWGSYGNRITTHWIAWEKICKPYSEGGLNLRNLNDCVTAFAFKLWWRLRSHDSLWADIMINKYCAKSCPTIVKCVYNASPVWRRLCKVRCQTHENMFWNLNEGKISFWYDQWLPEGILHDLVGGCNDEWGVMPVNMFWNDMTWNRDKLLEVLPLRLVNLIMEVPFTGIGRDSCIWKLTPNGKFNVASAWGLIRKVSSHQQINSHLWHRYFTPTISIFLWRLFSFKLPVDTKLQARGCSLASKCQCCSSRYVTTDLSVSNIESFEHLFLGSNQAKRIWQHFSHIFGFSVPLTSCVRIMFQFWKLSTPFSFKFHITVLIPCLIFWFIWCARNDSKHRGIVFSSDKIIGQIYMYLQNISQGKHFDFRVWRGFMHLQSKFMVHITAPPPLKITMVRWVPPEPGVLKLNSDGSVSQGQAGGGGLIRNSEGEVLQAFYCNLVADSSISAELKALDCGTAILSELEGENWWIELDASVLVQILNQESGGNWECQNVINRIRSRLALRRSKITHIYREGNKPADFLANLGCQAQQLCRLDRHNLPHGIKGLLRMDQLGLPNFRRSGIG